MSLLQRAKGSEKNPLNFIKVNMQLRKINSKGNLFLLISLLHTIS